MSQQEISALTRLLSDSNPQIAEDAADAQVAHGAAALPALRELADHHPALAALLTRRIMARTLEGEWQQLAESPDAEQAAILLARWLDPLLQPGALRRALDELAAPLQQEISGGQSRAAYRRDALTLREWLARAQGFRGNVEEYYAPENSLLPVLLETRRGTPLALSMLYLFVARRLGAPLYPIGMPYHFIVRYGSDQEGVYLDPFHDGALMTIDDCRRFLRQRGVPWKRAYLDPISDHALVARMLRNLVNAYAQRGDELAVAQVVAYLDIWTDHHRG